MDSDVRYEAPVQVQEKFLLGGETPPPQPAGRRRYRSLLQIRFCLGR